ncbi:MAG: glutamate synthase subunit beta [Chloroflexi bacterium]|nr:glutamate synthase subunit beta [Chloroflexota bacterium]
MGKITGFLESQREEPHKEAAKDRLKHWREFEIAPTPELLRRQGARCMDCGVPFCHKGCPLGNIIPDWNDLVYRDRWQDAIARLHSTNNFPEFTGRVCPAPCEEACVLSINNDPVTIKSIEHSIIDRAWAEGWVTPQPPDKKTQKRVAVVGSGPSGLASAQQLARAGHAVTLYERADRIGGLLRYGIPDFKLEKHHIDRRMTQMEAEGVRFVTNAHVGVNVPPGDLVRGFDAVVLTGGATKPRDLPVPGRDLAGVHFAMDFLPQQNRANAGDTVQGRISAKGKRVVILGGGDTGSDCLGTANRQGAVSVHQFELLPQPPMDRPQLSWPNWPMIMRTSSSHEEGVVRDFSISTKGFVAGEDGNVKALTGVRLDWKNEGGRPVMTEIPGSEFEIPCDLVLLALGFLGPEQDTMLAQLGVKLTDRGTVAVDQNGMTSVPGVFSAGDMRRGQSLVVWAIWEGREAARNVDRYLMGETSLPSSPDL